MALLLRDLPSLPLLLFFPKTMNSFLLLASKIAFWIPIEIILAWD